jgi:hypothetical protein
MGIILHARRSVYDGKSLAALQPSLAVPQTENGRWHLATGRVPPVGAGYFKSGFRVAASTPKASDVTAIIPEKNRK